MLSEAKRRLARLGFLGLLLSLLGACRPERHMYYVASTGDDTSDGSAEKPFHTIERATRAALPGDTIHVFPGEYEGFSIEEKPGSADRPLVVTADQGVIINKPGPHPKRPPFNRWLQTPTWPRWPHGIYVFDSSYVTIEGFEIRGMPDAERDGDDKLVHRGGAGIFVADSDHVFIRKNRVDDNGRWGIFTSFVDDVVIEDNECSRSHGEHGIYVSNSADHPIIRRNYCWGNTRAGIHINADIESDSHTFRARGGKVDGIISGAIIEANVLLDNGKGGAAGINCDGVHDAYIARNLLADNHSWGIALYQIDPAEGSHRNTITQNTIIMASDGRWAIQIADCESPDASTGRCVTDRRPAALAWATGSTGNIVEANVLLSKNVTTGSIRIDLASLIKGAARCEALRSDGNLLDDRLDVGGSVMPLSEWRTITGLDLHSLAVGAAPMPQDR